MGAAENWQNRLILELLHEYNITVLNPRRDVWNNDIQQTISDTRFLEQVEWEFQGQKLADLIVMYFSPTTKSPITLLELGLFASTKKMIVCCPIKFWRYGNVEFICQEYNIPFAKDWNGFKNLVKFKL